MRSASTTLSPKLSVSHAPLPDDFNTRPLTVLFMDAVGLLGTFILRDRFREPCCLVSSFFFSASEDRTACHWDASTGKGTIFIREQAFSITDMDASPESQSVVASPRNGQTHVVDPGVRTGAEQSSSGVNAIRLFPCSSDGVLVAACGPGTLLRIWAAKTGEVGSTFRGAGSQSSASALSPDSSRNIMTYGNNSHDVWYTGYDFVRPTSPS
jgi:WD40 repeat protein